MENQAWEELIERLIREGILWSPKVIRALRRVCRQPFLPERAKSYAAVDSPLPIGFGQTVSAPLG
jgi:protein-L-isoaspartate(D-aspartate) O-methyltransferase